MNHLGDVHLRTLTLRWMTLLAADPQDQIAWSVEYAGETEPIAEEARFFCRVGEGLAERGVLEPAILRDLETIGRRLDGITAAGRTGLWSDALAADPAWDGIRPVARQLLLAALGDWRQPLPRPARPHPDRS
ncbi:hypothetical protein ACFVWY_27500 [Streptomyces sp. NPDC058195]|uniref:hypothetical protein n=1 Tax=Streptomyces sp. NPDC058195 TaxID=3346375 RepID=UPI0036E33A4D